MQPDFPPTFFSNNRHQLRRALKGAEPIVISANGLLQRTADNSFPFQQDSNFWYLTGLNEPDLVLVMDKDGDYLIVPSRNSTRITFDGSLQTENVQVTSGITELVNERLGWSRIGRAVAATQAVRTITARTAYDRQHGIYANPAAGRVMRRLSRLVGTEGCINVQPALAKLRVHKQAPELAAIQAAVDITVDTLADIRAMLQTGNPTHEYQLEAELSRGFRNRGASGHSFSPIVANGSNATTLHNIANNAALDPASLTIFDVGAEVQHYAADITRTLAMQQPTARQAAIHTAVQEVQAYALSILKPGILPRDYETAVAKVMGTHLQQLKLITTVDAAAVRRYFPHATSHFLGLDTHDVGNYQQPYEPGMVVTCEPGIYIPEEGIGVRIEDDVLLTKTGSIILSSACPSSAF